MRNFRKYKSSNFDEAPPSGASDMTLRIMPKKGVVHKN